MRVKGVLIDFGDTLAYVDKANNRDFVEGLLAILESHGYQHNVDDLNLRLSGLYYESSKGLIRSHERFWQLLLTSLDMPVDPRVINELEDFREQNYATIFKLYEGVLPVLSGLHQKYRLALVSNCSIGLSQVTRTLGIADSFDAIVLSYEVGARKPDKRIYVEAIRQVQLEPGKCMFVSDEISDLEGANELGMKTLFVRQGNSADPDAKNPNFTPTFQCNHIGEIAKFLCNDPFLLTSGQEKNSLQWPRFMSIFRQGSRRLVPSRMLL